MRGRETVYDQIKYEKKRKNTDNKFYKKKQDGRLIKRPYWNYETGRYQEKIIILISTNL